jgi:hypothetical protein
MFMIMIMFMIMLTFMVMLMVMLMCAALTVHPARIAIDIVFLFPNRNSMFDFVDDVATGTKSLIAMRCADANPDCDLAERKITDAMYAARVGHTEFHACFFDDARTLSNSESFEGLVFEAAHFATFIEIAHPTFERGITAAGGIFQRSPQGVGVEIR